MNTQFRLKVGTFINISHFWKEVGLICAASKIQPLEISLVIIEQWMLKSSLLAKLCNCKDSSEFAIIQAGFGQIDNSLTVRMHYFNWGTAKGEILLCVQWDLNYTDLVALFRPSIWARVSPDYIRIFHSRIWVIIRITKQVLLLTDMPMFW